VNSDLRTNWLIAIALTGWLMYLLAPVLTPFVAAALLAYIGDPLADRLQKLGLPRTLAVVAVFLLTFLMIGLLLLLVGPLIQMQVAALFDALPDILRQFEQVWLPNIAELLNLDIGTDAGISSFLDRYGDMAGSWGTKVLVSVTQSGGALAAAVLSLFLVPIITFYLLRDWDSMLAHIGALIPAKQRETITQLARETDEVLGGGVGRIFARPIARHAGPCCYLFSRPRPGWPQVCDRNRCGVRAGQLRALPGFRIRYRPGVADGCVGA